MNMIPWFHLNWLATTMSFIVMSSSATLEVKKNLTGIEGGNITLPDPVLDLGFLSYGMRTIAMVSKKEIQIVEKIYKDKLLWDKNTGLFTITRLQRNDSGSYVIDPKGGSVSSTAYKLTVYEAVPPPVVVIESIRSDSCTLLCSVSKSVETTVRWYKDEQILNQSSSALSLPLTVYRQDFNSSYKCVAVNPAKETTLSVNVRAFCSLQEAETPRKHTIVVVISIMSVVIVVFVGCTIHWKLLDKKKRTTRQTGRLSEHRNRGSLY
ncbi:uncharacterized protein LOC113127891 isoform X2 [Mastacembelus armatus]|uniref:uncharacterized protein LOC113127891 isoform X2 n=1 Tax=Mastacembelus armatus TaxID=205130 RepID=UPI000E45D5A7|nr:uncharacterized protein LOC113127891 isoform X2 [Mastacembelus armatus]